MAEMRVVTVPDLLEGSHEWWGAEAQVCELVGLGGREIRLRPPADEELDERLGDVLGVLVEVTE